jgi:hypothetical protein
MSFTDKCLPDHLYISDDGSLYDTNQPDWHTKPPLRQHFQGHYTSTITTPAQLKAILRQGQYAWPGGYPLYFIMADGQPLSFQAARENFSELILGLQHKNISDDWRPVAIEVNWEDTELTCAHTNDKIPSAYGDS